MNVTQLFVVVTTVGKNLITDRILLVTLSAPTMVVVPLRSNAVTVMAVVVNFQNVFVVFFAAPIVAVILYAVDLTTLQSSDINRKKLLDSPLE